MEQFDRIWSIKVPCPQPFTLRPGGCSFTFRFFGVVMDRVSSDALIIILGYGGVSVYGRVNTLNIAFKIDASASDYIVRAVLQFPLDPGAVCALMNYDVSQSRVERLVGIARQRGDLSLINESEFRALIVLQLGLAHLQKSRPFNRNVTGQDIFELWCRHDSTRVLIQRVVIQQEL